MPFTILLCPKIEFFVAGTISFGLAHIIYIKSFGWNFINYKSFIILFFVYILAQTYIVSPIPNGKNGAGKSHIFF